jgi:hypothetical protein
VLATRFFGTRRVLMASPGRFLKRGGGCTLREDGLLADCRIGAGRAMLIADADLLHDLLWVGPGAIGTKRAGRLADNAAFVVGRLDELAGRGTRAGGDRVSWITRAESFDSAVLAALAVPGSGLLAGMILLVRARRIREKRFRQTYPQGRV